MCVFGFIVVCVANVTTFDVVQADDPSPREGHFEAPEPPLEMTLSSGSADPSYYQTSEYMIGSVAVGLILPESNGALDAQLNDWTPEQRERVGDEVREALQWWVRQSPVAPLTFVIDDHARVPVPTVYEPITRPQSEEGLWIGDALANLGYSGASYWTQVRDYVNDLRDTYQTDWAFAIFVVNSEGDADGAFADNYFAYAYLGGPFMVMTYSNAGYGIEYMDAVVAHEVGHIFRALDQYSVAHVPCTARAGYLGVETQNSQQPGCHSDVPSIMRGGIFPYVTESIDAYARGQLGWLDSDSDGIYDPVDTTPELSAEIESRAGNEWDFSGNAVDVPYPSPSRPAATINTVSVEYSIDGAAWRPADPLDGSFDSPYEDYSLELSLNASGNHHIFVRARNSAGNVSDAVRHVSVVPDAVDGGLDTWLDPNSLAPRSNSYTLRGIASSYNDDGAPGDMLDRIEYRISGGAWQSVEARDGAIDSHEENYSIALVLPAGSYQLEVRAMDATGRVEQKVAAAQLVVQFDTFLPMLGK
jgi:hypothetical protein